MRGKLTCTALAGIFLVVMATAVAREGVALGVAALVLVLAGIALIQVGAHEPADHT